MYRVLGLLLSEFLEVFCTFHGTLLRKLEKTNTKERHKMSDPNSASLDI